MSQQTVLNLKEALEKNLLQSKSNKEDDVDVDRVVDVLDRLNEIQMNLSLLQETLIGATVNKYKKHKVDSISTKAKILIKQWKSLAAAETAVQEEAVAVGDANNSSSMDPSTRPIASSSGTTHNDDDDSNNIDRKEQTNSKSNKNNKSKKDGKSSVGIKSHSVGGDGADVGDNVASINIVTPANEWKHLPSQRQQMCEKIYESLLLVKNKLLKELQLDTLDNANMINNIITPVSMEIEQSIYKYSSNDRKKYSDKARSIFFNLKKNSSLCLQLCLGQVESSEVVHFTAEQLASAEILQQRMDSTRKLIESKRLDWDQANEDKINEQCGIKGELLKASLFTCGRCKSIKTTSTQKQTRSADEPMTVFVLCLNCGKRWKC